MHPEEVSCSFRTVPMSEVGETDMSALRSRQARYVKVRGAGVCEKDMSSSVEVEKAYQDLFRFCLTIGGIHSIEEAMIQWELQKKVALSPSLKTALERRCKCLGLPQS